MLAHHHVHILGLPLGHFIAWIASIAVVAFFAVLATKILRSALVIVILAAVVWGILWVPFRYGF